MALQPIKMVLTVIAISELSAIHVGVRESIKQDLVDKNVESQLETPTIDQLETPTIDQQQFSRHHLKVTQGDNTCIVMDAIIRMEILYSSFGERRVSTFYIPDKYSTSGTCSNSDGINTITIGFFGTWSLTIYISKTTSYSYGWSRIEFKFSIDKDRFPGLIPELDTEVHINQTLSEGSFEVNTNFGSLFCKGPASIQLRSDVVLTFIDLQYRAFGNSAMDLFSDQGVQKCEPIRLRRNDRESNNSTNTDDGSTVTIALSASGGLVSFAILLCCIYFCCCKG